CYTGVVAYIEAVGVPMTWIASRGLEMAVGNEGRTNPQPSVTPGPLGLKDSKTPWFSRTIEVLHDPRLFAPRRFSSERQCPPPADPTQAAHPPPDREPTRRRAPRADAGRRQHPLRADRPDPGHRPRRDRGHPPPGPQDRPDPRPRSWPPPPE